MSKINLGIDFSAVRERIDAEMTSCTWTEWAKKVGVSKNIVTNVHGGLKQKPSIEYTIAVSVATGKPVEYFLWGKKADTPIKEDENARYFEEITELQEWLFEICNEEPARRDWFKMQIIEVLPD